MYDIGVICCNGIKRDEGRGTKEQTSLVLRPNFIFVNH
jgi:hypothetical protein